MRLIKLQFLNFDKNSFMNLQILKIVILKIQSKVFVNLKLATQNQAILITLMSQIYLTDDSYHIRSTKQKVSKISNVKPVNDISLNRFQKPTEECDNHK